MKSIDMALFAGAALFVVALIITRRGAADSESPGAAGKAAIATPSYWTDLA